MFFHAVHVATQLYRNMLMNTWCIAWRGFFKETPSHMFNWFSQEGHSQTRRCCLILVALVSDV